MSTTQPKGLMTLEEALLTKGEALFLRVRSSPEFCEKLRLRLMSSCSQLDSGCWKWDLRLDGWGYGIVRLPGRVSTLAHRISFVVHGGILTKERPLVLHSCHNTWCINPKHLRAGTQKENEQDKYLAGRHYGKLNHDKVAKVRVLISDGKSDSEIAPEFNVSPSHIWRIRTGKSWALRLCAPTAQEVKG